MYRELQDVEQENIECKLLVASRNVLTTKK